MTAKKPAQKPAVADHERASNANETLRIGLLMTASEKHLPQGSEKMLESAVSFLKDYYGAK